MTIRRARRDATGIDPLNLYAAIDPLSETDLHDPSRLDDFIQHMKQAVEGSLQVDSRLHGLRVQALFRAVLVALGEFELLVDEDEGEPYYDDSIGEVKPPDFRVVQRGRDQLLIEVKNVPPANPTKPHALSVAEVEGLRRYADIMGVPVAVAHYWSAWNRWTLVDLEKLNRRGEKYEIDLPAAMRANLLSRFGDCAIGTPPPLALVFRTTDLSSPEDDEDTATVRIEDVRLRAAGVDLESDEERSIAWFLLRFGDWQAEQAVIRGDDGRVEAIEIRVGPLPEHLEAIERQGFGMVGMLSSMYSSLYNEATLTQQGGVREVRHEPDPGQLGRLIPDDFWDRGHGLKIWRLHIQPEG
jgi:hypothetical protein